MLASAGVLALVRDAPAAEVPPAAGSVLAVRGAIAPFEVPDGPAWEPVAALLDEVTYLLEPEAPAKGPRPEAVVLVTAATPRPAGRDVAVQGIVLWQGPHPDDAARTLVLLQGAWDAPILPR